MTIEEKRWVLGLYCDTQCCDSDCALFGDACRCGRGHTFEAAPDEKAYMTDDEIIAAFTMAFPNRSTDPTGQPMDAEFMKGLSMGCIKDSGERREFDTGAVRDIQEGKGRCDLMPLDVVADYYGKVFGQDDSAWKTISPVSIFMEFGDPYWLIIALSMFVEESDFTSHSDMLLEVSKHFEDGAKKYGEHNWQKGIPVKCYIDSAVRHYLKWLRGDKDEPHDRAFCWNILCAIWTCKHKPELNDYRKENDHVDD